ncbi:uncharacterized protein LOC131306842 [Rhododendron vialii]|uniref:uncharacterized protein LOC131306842 n=1 Tax=Rhododendron vialii TaxID=182163 RepID=UPI00265E3142|nr:uncharacterized protein LOC131306842 [Rhododendron vialii]
MHERTAQPPTVSQVAAMWIEDEDATELQKRSIIVQKHDGHSKRISYYYGCYDSLQYPLLFPLGEPGWHQGIKKIKANITDLLCSSHSQISPIQSLTADDLLANEAAVHAAKPDKTSMVSARKFYAYRFQIRPNTTSILLQCGRLLQQFAVDMYVKIETSRLDYFRNRQHEIRADYIKELLTA